MAALLFSLGRRCSWVDLSTMFQPSTPSFPCHIGRGNGSLAIRCVNERVRARAMCSSQFVPVAKPNAIRSIALSNFSARIASDSKLLCGRCTEINLLNLLMLATRTSEGLDLVMGFHRLMRFAARQIGSAAALFALGRIHDFHLMFRGGIIRSAGA